MEKKNWKDKIKETSKKYWALYLDKSLKVFIFAAFIYTAVVMMVTGASASLIIDLVYAAAFFVLFNKVENL